MRLRVRDIAISLLITSVPIALMAITSQTPEAGRAPEPLASVLIEGSALWYPWAVMALVIDRRVRSRHPSGRRERIWVFAGHVAAWVIFATIHGTITYATAHMLWPLEPRASPAILGQFVPDAILYAAIAAGFMIAESRRRQTEVAERLRAEVAEARLDALRQQLNPHFLFNTLNHIVMQLRSRNVEPAERMLLTLSDLLRDVLKEKAQLIPLRDEVRMVERYLEIERERFGDRLQAEVTFEPRALDALVPSLLLQPLLENAMRHGVSAADGCCRLSLCARTRDDRLLIDVRDAGPGLDPDAAASPAGVGLKNTSERLRYLYGAGHAFDLRTLDGGGLLVSIDLPFRRA